MANVDIRTPEHNGRGYATPTEHVASSTTIERAARAVGGGSLVEAIAGAAGVALPILGLLGVMPLSMAAFACIAIGIGLCISGAAVSARWRDIVREVAGHRHPRVDVGGLTAEILGGASGIALGVLALFDIYPEILMPVAAIVFGGTLIFASSVKAELAALGAETERAERVARQATRATAGAQVLAGIAAIVLGVLTLVDITGDVAGIVFTHIALLCVGASMVLSSTALGSRMLAVIRR